MKGILEVCVDSLASARAAVAGGADRLELCSALVAGGLTPYTGLLEQIKAETDIPVRCLIRCREGDFLYAPEELALMERQIARLKQAGADGFVLGCLTAEGELDTAAMEPLLATCGDCGVTLHRCIDVSRNPARTYRDAMGLGLDTILTSGAAASCLDGLDTISVLLEIRDAMAGPEVLIGAGVNARAIADIRKKLPGARAFHMSGKTQIESGMRFRREGVPMGLPGLDEWHLQQTDPDAVAAAKKVLAE